AASRNSEFVRRLSRCADSKWQAQPGLLTDLPITRSHARRRRNCRGDGRRSPGAGQPVRRRHSREGLIPILPRYLEALEFPKVLALLKRHTSFSASAALADALLPSADVDEINREQETVAEARLLIESRPGTGVRAAHDIRAAVRHAALAGVLQPWQLLEI